MSHISLTVPRDDEKALVAGATMLLTLAGKIPNMELPAASDDGHCESCTSAAREAPTETLLQEIESFDSDPVAPPPPPVATDDTPTTEEEETNLDANGLPWDARIHAGSKAKLQDGTWRKKRGVDEEDYNRVVEELKQLMAAPMIDAEAVDTKTYPEEHTEEIKTTLNGVQGFTPPPPPPGVAGIVPTEPEPTPDTFPAFLKAVTMKVQAKELTIEEVNNALQPHGVANLQLLGGRPDLIPQVWADLVAPK